MGCEYVRSRGNDDAVVVHAFFMNSAHRQSSCEKCEICLFAINFVQLVCSLWHWQDHTDHDHAVCLLQKFSVVSQARVASFRPQHHMIFFIPYGPRPYTIPDESLLEKQVEPLGVFSSL